MTQILELADSIESLKGGSASSGSKNITLTSRQQSASGVSDGLGVLSAKVEQLEQEIRRIMQQHPPLEGAIGGVESPSVDGTASASNAVSMHACNDLIFIKVVFSLPPLGSGTRSSFGSTGEGLLVFNQVVYLMHQAFASPNSKEN